MEQIRNMKKDFRKYFMSKFPFRMSVLDDRIKSLQSPYILEEREMHVTQMDVFSRLMMNRIIVFADHFDATTCSIILAQLEYLDSLEKEKITLQVNSPGGEVYSGMGLIETMNFIESPVATCNIGMCASMGAMLLMSGEPGMRSALPHTRTMIHQPLGGASGQASNIIIEAKEIERCRTELYEVIHKCTGQPLDKIASDADRDYWLTPEEAKDYGIIDMIINKKTA